MGEAKRRTAEQRKIAAGIDGRMRQLDALRLQEAEILPAMAEHMAAFYCLLTSSTPEAWNALCEEFAGFYRFAKLAESIAGNLASGKIDAPGSARLFDENRVASTINQRVLQLEAQGITGHALLQPMVGHILDFQRLWSTASDEALAHLCRRYPGLYRYGLVMEAASEENKKGATAYSHLPMLPESVKRTVAQLLHLGALLERGLQAVIDGHGQRDTSIEDALLETQHGQWVAILAALPGELHAAGVPAESKTIMMSIFEPMAQRIDRLRRLADAQRV